MKPKSESLFHLTLELDYLLDILRFGFWPRYCLEDIEWLGLNDKYVAFPMVCFCEIPFNRMGTHLDNYAGKGYGIGVRRDWAESKGINPVNYVVPNSNVADIYKELISNGCKDQLRKLAAFCKPVRGKMPRFTDVVEFYQESEWRYVPRDGLVAYSLLEDSYNNIDVLNEANDRSKRSCSLILHPEFIDFILVPDDSDIPVVYSELKKQYGASPAFPVLVSKITTVDRIMGNA